MPLTGRLFGVWIWELYFSFCVFVGKRTALLLCTELSSVCEWIARTDTCWYDTCHDSDVHYSWVLKVHWNQMCQSKLQSTIYHTHIHMFRWPIYVEPTSAWACMSLPSPDWLLFGHACLPVGISFCAHFADFTPARPLLLFSTVHSSSPHHYGKN